MRVVVAGGTGLIGRALTRSLAQAGHEVVVLSRSADAHVEGATTARWDGMTADETVLADARAVVNLSGEPLGGGRWTTARKQRIEASRVDSTDALVSAVARLEPARRPRVLVNASGVGALGDRGDETLDEDAAPGDTPLARIASRWEGAALAAEQLGLRVVLMRTAVAFHRDAKAFRLLVLPFRLFVGGRLGSGRQWLPWIHLDDLVRLYVLAIEDEALQGAVHAAGPEPVRQAELARAIGRALRRPALLPTPAWLLRLALGDQSELLLESQRVVSRKLDAGSFLYPRLDDALAEALAPAVRP
jgi:uncharacterized protein (TIGR01777 family)